MSAIQASVLSIAGFDPSGGAGILADIKTAESTGITAFGVVTCITYQNQNEIVDVKWESIESIIKQLTVLKKAHDVDAVKLGVVESVEMLKAILESVLAHWPNCKIVWDPVIRSTSGFRFFHWNDLNNVLAQLKSVDLITPNLDEAHELFEHEDLANLECGVLLTGVKNEVGEVEDRLYANGERKIFQSKSHNFKKHGSGCVLSTSIACGLACGLVLTETIENSVARTQHFLKSSPDLLGKHQWT